MCKYVRENKCSITEDNCPFMYFCTKINNWKPLNSMPENCMVKERFEVPKGYYKVRMERKGFLYIDIDNQTIKVPNPFEEIPLYVKAYKLRNGQWRLKKYEG